MEYSTFTQLQLLTLALGSRFEKQLNTMKSIIAWSKKNPVKRFTMFDIENFYSSVSTELPNNSFAMGNIFSQDNSIIFPLKGLK